MSMHAVTDMHVHVGIPGTEGSPKGFMSNKMKQGIGYKVLLLYARVPPEEATDERFIAGLLETIAGAEVGKVICVGLDQVYGKDGKPRLDRTTMHVSNEFVLGLQKKLKEEKHVDKILFGASVHPYDPEFRKRVDEAVGQGAVLLKWIASSQLIDLADDRVRSALEYLATANHGGPLPLLLHSGMEGEIEPTDPRAVSYDFLSWSWRDAATSFLRSKHWYRPDLKRVHANLAAGLNAGGCIIFSHCGLPYFAPDWLAFLEHSDFDVVADYLENYPGWNGTIQGKAFADVSACVTPLRATWFDRIRKLPAGSLLYGSDFPVPVFELSAGAAEHMEDFKAILKGDLSRIIIPEDNLLDVSLREMQHAFPGHPMFTNAEQIPGWAEVGVG